MRHPTLCTVDIFMESTSEHKEQVLKAISSVQIDHPSVLKHCRAHLYEALLMIILLSLVDNFCVFALSSVFAEQATRILCCCWNTNY